jgi:hypothetical protein
MLSGLAHRGELRSAVADRAIVAAVIDRGLSEIGCFLVKYDLTTTAVDDRGYRSNPLFGGEVVGSFR